MFELSMFNFKKCTKDDLFKMTLRWQYESERFVKRKVLYTQDKTVTKSSHHIIKKNNYYNNYTQNKRNQHDGFKETFKKRIGHKLQAMRSWINSQKLKTLHNQY